LFFDLFRLLCLDSCRLKINDSYTNRNRNDVCRRSFSCFEKKNRWERIVCGAVLDWSAIEKSSDVLIHSCSGDGLCCFINKIS
jgi:hypothetical protein